MLETTVLDASVEAMAKAIEEVEKTTNELSLASDKALKQASNTGSIISELKKSSHTIGNIIKVISSIAQQTNILALNATIEAARVGDAGKGFAVVAKEVKELAKQTAQAADDMVSAIETIQKDTTRAADGMDEIHKAVEQANTYSKSIATCIHKQESSTEKLEELSKQLQKHVLRPEV